VRIQIGLGNTRNKEYVEMLQKIAINQTAEKIGVEAVGVIEIHNFLLLPPAARIGNAALDIRLTK